MSGHFKRLVQYGALKLVKERPRRGAVEHFYAGTKRAVFTENDWETLPESIQSEVAGAALLDFLGISSRAIETGRFSTRSDVVFTWDEFMLDELAWKSMTAMLNLVWEKLADLQEESAIRMAQNGEPGVATVVGLAGFEAPKGNPEAKPRKRK